MGIDSFNNLMTDTVTIEPAAGLDQYGFPTYGAAVTYRGRIFYRSRSARNNVAEVAAPRGMIWIAGTPAVDLADRVTLPDGSQPTILLIEAPTDQAGIHHVKITFGWGGSNVNAR